MRCITARVLFPLVFLLVLTPVVMAENFTGQQTFSASDLTITQKAGMDVIELKDGTALMVPGSPALPGMQVNVALPDGADVITTRLISADFEELDGTYNVIPATRPRRIGNPSQSFPFVKDQNVYSTDAAYPGVWIEQGAEWDLVGQQFVTIDLYPVQYNPTTGKVFVATNISYEVVYTVDSSFERRTYNFSENVRAHYNKRLTNLAVNPDALTLPEYAGSGSRALPAGDFEYVIITTTAFENSWDSLVDHYTKVGIPVEVMTNTWVDSNYYGTGATSIRNFVSDAHSTWGTIYFLIGGDTSKVAAHSRSLLGDSIPNDTYYADYDGDWHIEVYLGRASVDTTTEISNFLNKTLDYLQSPPSGFGEEVFGMGFDLDSYTDGEDTIMVADNYYPAWSTKSQEFDSESGGHETDVKAYINAGQGVVLHTDHCYHDVIGVGSYNHGTGLSKTEVSAFYNGGRQGVFYTLGCWPGAFDYNDCIGEKMAQNTGGGCAAFVGNTRYGWYYQGSHNTLSSYNLIRFSEALFQDGAERVGEANGEHKEYNYPGDSYEQYIFTELNVTGDPALHVWTDVPGTFNCTYDTSIVAGSQSYTVNVKEGASNYIGALVCVWKDDEVYARTTTNYSGNATFTILPVTNGTMYVTVSDQNMNVHEGLCTVTGGSTQDLTIDLSLDKSSYPWFSTLYYTLEATNNTGSTQNTYVWCNVTLPGGNIYPASGYLYHGPWAVTLTAYQTRSATLSQNVGTAPPGSYTFNAYIGPEPGIEDADHVPFSITY